ncbi:MAG: acyl-ACP--UDP-N-acetylglucosamine O-acyltransferase [bacterium]
MKQFTISKNAKVDKSVIIGPYSVIEDDVKIAADNKIGGHVIIRNGSIIGKGNTICAGVQIGVDPQDYHFKGEPSKCLIGDNNIIREYTTISRATGENKATCIGDNNFIMTYVHIAHNIRIGNNNIISSGSQLGGYVELENFVNTGGLVGVHQFCRIGKYAMLGAMSYLNKDIPPYMLARGNPARVFGVNVRGLQLNGFTTQEVETIKTLYRLIYESSNTLTQCLKRLEEKDCFGDFARETIEFVNASKRGILLKTP